MRQDLSVQVEDLNAPASGRSLVILQGARPLAAAVLTMRVVRLGPTRRARHALLGPFTPAGDTPLNSTALEAVIAFLSILDGGVDVARFSCTDDDTVALVCRAAVASDCRSVVSDTGIVTTVDVYRPTFNAELLAAMATFPGRRVVNRMRQAFSQMRNAMRYRERGPRRLLTYRADPGELEDSQRFPAEFRFVDPADVRRRPGSYGIVGPFAHDSSAWRTCAGIVDNRVVYRMQVTSRVASILESLPLPQREMLPTPCWYVAGCETHYSFRGRGIYPAALRWLRARALDESVGCVLIQVRSDNLSSRRGVERAGFSLVDARPV